MSFSPESSLSQLNMNFESNGKLGAIYHWNLPVLKKMLERNHNKNSHNTYYRNAEDEEMLDIKNIPTWSDPWIEAQQADLQQMEKKYKKKVPVFYAPVKKNKKFFPGNGKPKGFYVMKGQSNAVRYQKLLVWSFGWFWRRFSMCSEI